MTIQALEKRVEWLELQMDLVHRTLDKIDRKTENSSEIPNNCDEQTVECPFDDSIPCEWICTEYGNCKYKPKNEPQTDLLVTEYPQDGEVNLIGRDKTEAVVMAYDVYKELTEPYTGYKKWDAPPKVDLPTGEITTCVTVLASALEIEDEPQTDCSWK